MEANDIIKIIDQCARSGVSKFKFDKIEIEFNGFAIHTEKDYPIKADKVDNFTVDPNFALEQEILEKEIELDELMITDPAEYEKKLFEDQLEDSEDGEV